MLQFEQTMSEIFNELSELVYISDFETYELLYCNEIGSKTFNLQDIKGQKCYEILQNRDTPCPFCNNARLDFDKYYTWYHTNAVTGQHYLLKDRLIEWNGRKARLEIAFDVTEQQREKIELKNSLESQLVMLDCVKDLYKYADFEQSIPKVLERLGTYLEAERAYIFEFHEDKMTNTHEWCSEKTFPAKSFLQNIDASLASLWMPTLEKSECYILEDLESDSDYEPEAYEVLAKQNIKSIIAAPLERNGELFGFFGVDNPPMEKTKNIASLMQTLCYFVMLAYGRDQHKIMLEHLSYTDELTGLLNRNRYIQDLKTKKDSQSIGVIYLDVNGLKDINDQFGHEYGDKVLISCADCMREIFPGAYNYRIGGDEFVITCYDIDKQDFDHFIARLKKEFEKKENCRCAIGAYWSQEPQNLQEMISLADNKMYENKKSYYRHTLKSKRYRHETDVILELCDRQILKQRILEGRFEIYFQPKVSMWDQKPIGAEALVRYRSDNSLILPGDFIPLLEDSQCIDLIDFYIFESICKRLQTRLDEGKKVLPVSVNLSRTTLGKPNFLEQITFICDRYPNTKEYLELEIKEHIEQSNLNELKQVVDALRKAGFVVSLDDFGTSRSNLSILFSTNFDVVKLDKSLIRVIEHNKRSQEIFKHLIHSCETLNIRVIAEGVENKEQAEILKQIGLQNAQGFFFKKPISAAEYEAEFLQ